MGFRGPKQRLEMVLRRTADRRIVTPFIFGPDCREDSSSSSSSSSLAGMEGASSMAFACPGGSRKRQRAPSSDEARPIKQTQGRCKGVSKGFHLTLREEAAKAESLKLRGIFTETTLGLQLRSLRALSPSCGKMFSFLHGLRCC